MRLISRNNLLRSMPLLVGIFVLLAYGRFSSHKMYANPMYTVGLVKSVTEGSDITYQYKVGGVMYINGSVQEYYGTNYEEEYRKRIGKRFVVRFNKEDPDYAVMYLSCEIEDSISAPSDGWQNPPIKCEGQDKRKGILR